jgi:excisionase family DNA binding protein
MELVLRTENVIESRLTVGHAAKIANVHEETIRRAYLRGELRVERIGRAIRIKPSELERWLARGAQAIAA